MDKRGGQPSESVYSSYLLTETIHPHGQQAIPRSILFGADTDDYDKTKPEKKFVKTFWAQDDVRYSRLFEQTELFIIFGMSMTATDSWWMDHIYDQLAKEDDSAASAEEKELVKKRIFVVPNSDNQTYFLGFPSPKAENPNN